MNAPVKIPSALRVGGWMQTFTGKQFFPLDPDPEDIDIEDIAHALGMLCRYGGHSRRFYSVAEHSVQMSLFAPTRELKKWCLAHDMSEAYLVDVPRPIKKYLTNYKAIEEKLSEVIYEKFGLKGPIPPEVTELDNRILLDERDAFMKPPPADWGIPGKPLGARLLGLYSEQARLWFLEEWEKVA